ncbi:MAG: hypothetical protein ABL927_07905, partial [Bdellovibrionales bacterium]
MYFTSVNVVVEIGFKRGVNRPIFFYPRNMFASMPLKRGKTTNYDLIVFFIAANIGYFFAFRKFKICLRARWWAAVADKTFILLNTGQLPPPEAGV